MADICNKYSPRSKPLFPLLDFCVFFFQIMAATIAETHAIATPTPTLIPIMFDFLTVSVIHHQDYIGTSNLI